MLDARMSIWAVKSPANESAWDPAKSARENSALFKWNSNNPVQYSDPSGYESGEVAVTCAINRCNDMSPAAANVFVKGEVGALGVSGSVTVTGEKKVFVSKPNGAGIAAGPGTKAAIASVGSGIVGVTKSTFSASATFGLVAPNPGKTAADVIGGPSTSTSINIPIAGGFGFAIDHSVNGNGSTIGFGIGWGAGASVTQGTATQINKTNNSGPQ